MRRTRDTIIGSRLQVRTRCDTFRGAIQVGMIAPDVEKFGFAITANYQRSIRIGVFQLVCGQNHFLSRWCSLGQLWLGVSKDKESSDSLRKVLIRKVREMDVAVNWLNFELVVGKGCPWEKVASERRRTWGKTDFLCFSVVSGMCRDCWDKDYSSLWRTLAK